MNLPFEPDLDQEEDNRKYIECENCNAQMHYESNGYVQDDCYFIDGRYLCEDCFADHCKENYYWRLED